MNSVKSYYDDNTNSILQSGVYGKTKNIHRQVWGPGVTTEEAAVNYINQLVLHQLKKQSLAHPTVLDLGCGVGGCLYYLAQHYSNARYYGITISPVQVRRANDIAKTLELDNDCHITEGDYHQLPPHVPKVDVAYAVESFLHATNPAAFFEQISQKLNPGGRLIICDDMRSSKPLGKKGEKYLTRFKTGWVVGTLLTVPALERLAQQYGLYLIEKEDLTPYLVQGLPIDKMVKLIATLFHPLVKYSNYMKARVGGDALQTCLMEGWVEFWFLVFEKR